jgi:hypothetical protein
VKHLGVTRSTNPTQQPAGLPIPTAAVDRLWRQQATAPTHLRRLLERHRTLVGWQSQAVTCVFGAARDSNPQPSDP